MLKSPFFGTPPELMQNKTRPTALRGIAQNFMVFGAVDITLGAVPSRPIKWWLMVNHRKSWDLYIYIHCIYIYYSSLPYTEYTVRCCRSSLAQLPNMTTFAALRRFHPPGRWRRAGGLWSFEANLQHVKSQSGWYIIYYILEILYILQYVI
jgi:hypothetical protein